MARTLVLAGKIGPAFGRQVLDDRTVQDYSSVSMVNGPTMEQYFERRRPSDPTRVQEGYSHRNAFRDGQPTIATIGIRSNRVDQIERLLGYVAQETGTYADYVNAAIEADSKAIARREAEHVCGGECTEAQEEEAAYFDSVATSQWLGTLCPCGCGETTEEIQGVAPWETDAEYFKDIRKGTRKGTIEYDGEWS